MPNGLVMLGANRFRSMAGYACYVLVFVSALSLSCTLNKNKHHSVPPLISSRPPSWSSARLPCLVLRALVFILNAPLSMVNGT